MNFNYRHNIIKSNETSLNKSKKIQTRHLSSWKIPTAINLFSFSFYFLNRLYRVYLIDFRRHVGHRYPYLSFLWTNFGWNKLVPTRIRTRVIWINLRALSSPFSTSTSMSLWKMTLVLLPRSKSTRLPASQSTSWKSAQKFTDSMPNGALPSITSRYP